MTDLERSCLCSQLLHFSPCSGLPPERQNVERAHLSSQSPLSLLLAVPSCPGHGSSGYQTHPHGRHGWSAWVGPPPLHSHSHPGWVSPGWVHQWLSCVPEAWRSGSSPWPEGPAALMGCSESREWLQCLRSSGGCAGASASAAGHTVPLWTPATGAAVQWVLPGVGRKKSKGMGLWSVDCRARLLSYLSHFTWVRWVPTVLDL